MFITDLKKYLKQNLDKRIIVLGTTCTGKSTLLKSISFAQDMDDLIFPKLTKKEKECVCKSPWTKEIGKTMIRLVRTKIKVKSGKPLFGTVILDCDLIVYLVITNKLLKKRTKLRKSSYIDAKNMQKQILDQIKKSKIPFVKYKIE
jgi:hypothetical protein